MVTRECKVCSKEFETKTVTNTCSLKCRRKRSNELFKKSRKRIFKENKINGKNKLIECACGCKGLLWKFDKWGKRRKKLNEHKQRGRKLSKEAKNKIRLKAIGRIASNKSKEKMSRIGKERWSKINNKERKEHGKKLSIAMNKSKKFKAMFKNPEWRKKQSESHKGIKRSKESCLKQSKTMQGHFVSKETRKKISLNSSGKNNGMYGAVLDKNPMWKGGKSFEPYPLEFNKQLKDKIKKRDNFECKSPFHNPKKPFKRIAVHHIDYVKENLGEKNLIVLCTPCHFKTNHNRGFWKKILMKTIHSPKPLIP